MFGSERTEVLVLAVLVGAFVLCVVASLSIWLTVFFGLLAGLQAVGTVEDATTVWRM